MLILTYRQIQHATLALHKSVPLLGHLSLSLNTPSPNSNLFFFFNLMWHRWLEAVRKWELPSLMEFTPSGLYKANDITHHISQVRRITFIGSFQMTIRGDEIWEGSHLYPPLLDPQQLFAWTQTRTHARVRTHTHTHTHTHNYLNTREAKQSFFHIQWYRLM